MESKTENGTVLADHNQYRIVLAPDQNALLFEWKRVEGMGLQDFRSGVAEFAGLCKTRQPTRALIDARQLDPSGTALAWVSGRETPAGEEEYMTWWSREIVPVYHEAGISSLAVATGDPNAPGELPHLPSGGNFKMGYFSDLESALGWQVD